MSETKCSVCKAPCDEFANSECVHEDCADACGDGMRDPNVVASLLEDNGFGMVLDAPENTFLCVIPLDTDVGKAAASAIAAAKTFALALDPHPDVRAKIGQALAAHIRILYFG